MPDVVASIWPYYAQFYLQLDSTGWPRSRQTAVRCIIILTIFYSMELRRCSLDSSARNLRLIRWMHGGVWNMTHEPLTDRHIAGVRRFTAVINRLNKHWTKQRARWMWQPPVASWFWPANWMLHNAQNSFRHQLDVCGTLAVAVAAVSRRRKSYWKILLLHIVISSYSCVSCRRLFNRKHRNRKFMSKTLRFKHWVEGDIHVIRVKLPIWQFFFCIEESSWGYLWKEKFCRWLWSSRRLKESNSLHEDSSI